MKKIIIIVILTIAVWVVIAKIITGCYTAICGSPN